MEQDLIAEKFLQEIRETFPEVSIRLDTYMQEMGWEPEDKMYTTLMEQFSQATTDAINSYDEKTASDHLNYMSQKLNSANSVEKEYIDVYYVESLMWDSRDSKKQKFGWELMPKNLQDLYYNFWGRKTYYEEK